MRRLALLTLTLCGCMPTGDTFGISLGADGRVDSIDAYVRDDASGKILEHLGWTPVSKDLTAAPFKLGFQLDGPGHYSFFVIGIRGTPDGNMIAMDATEFFWAGTAEVDGNLTVDATLRHVPPTDNIDRDLFPDAVAWLADIPAVSDIPADLLDCDDRRADVNPLAPEVCGDGIDQNCDGHDIPCTDSDGDGDPDSTDCAPTNPKIHHPQTDPKSPHYDPFPEAANCCGYSLGKTGAAETLLFENDPTCHPGTCGDGIDQDCSAGGKPEGDEKCIADQDCDTYPAAAMQNDGCKAPSGQPPGNDCDDCDPAINPAATDVCNGKDDNCNGKVDETCVSCDLDGDGFERTDPMVGCPDAMNANKPLDCNDNDAGVFPGSTGASFPLSPKLKCIGGVLAQCSGREGGTVCGALRATCRNTNPDSSPQDADCDGSAAKGCPSKNCDADGDGFIDAAKAQACDPMGISAPYDCDDLDATTFPGAPPQCGESKPHNCVSIVNCTGDGDGDGFPTDCDCDDTDKNVHPFARETCNGIDDDCDGLIDELNPDASGNPMVTNLKITSCSDSGIGECGAPTGRCVCSALSNAFLFFDQATRRACPGETANVDQMTGSAARCYGAIQPTADICNGKDESCDGGLHDGWADCQNDCCGMAGCAMQQSVSHCGCQGVACDTTIADGCRFLNCACNGQSTCDKATQKCVAGTGCLKLPGQPCQDNSECASLTCNSGTHACK
jgi:hypothetical protein